jgi:hypothetical protein
VALHSLREALAATAWHSAIQFSWFGVVSADVPEHVRPILQGRPDVARLYLRDTLSNRLYEDFYQAGRARPSPSPYAGSLRAQGSPEFVNELSAANMGSGTRQTGWLVTDVRRFDGGEIELSIRREELTLRAMPAETVWAGDGLPGIGDEVDLRMPKELPAISPGFYTVLSDEPYSARGRQVVRMYWNLYPWGAKTLVQEITTRLNRAGLPFRLKLVNHPDRYTRCDAAVLYVLEDHLADALPLLAKTCEEVRADLKMPVPALTKWIAPGIGLAEDPPDGDSFGQSRCRLLAEGMVRGWELGTKSIEERFAVVVETFKEAGIDPERPYRNPGSLNDYDFSFGVGRSTVTGRDVSTSRISTPSMQSFGAQDYLDVAASISAQICTEAFWHQGLCNWLGVQPRDPSAPAHQGMTYRSLGPELYGGASGVALFLAEFAVATGDEEARKTALGAIRQALGRADTIEPSLQLGFYTGRLGLAYVAARIGTLLDEADVTSAAGSLLENAEDGLATQHEHDLLSGSAGGIVALFRLAELLDDRSLVDQAGTLGRNLLSATESDGSGCSWPSPLSPDKPNLTGLSHGAAGIGLALFELWHATQDERFHTVAARAFDFERRWFNPEQGNWPDFRTVEGLADRPDRPFPYATFWCHGAPGIALSRLRAWELTGNSQYREQAMVALSTTEQAIHQALHDGTSNYSLCHGLTGNAEILLRGYHALGSEFEHLKTTALQVANQGVGLYAAPDRDWPCGTHGGWSPGLMLGIAGIGRFYLYLAQPSLPCILLPTSS